MLRSTVPLSLIALALVFQFLPAMAAGDDEVRATMGRISSHWTPDEWTVTISYNELSDYAARPADEKLQRITVEWRQPELDGLGNFCIIRGRLMLGEQPIDWFQGVTVYMARSPGAQPDWSGGMNQEDTLRKTGVVNRSGEFTLRIDARESEHDRTIAERFQFGLALARHTETGADSQNVVWSSRTPAISTSVQMLEVPAAAELSRELDLINRASGWPFQNPNGVDLIRAVNALQRLGKEPALATLERYLELTNTFDYFEDTDIVFWIIRVLFEPIRLEDRIPPPMIAVYLDDRGLPEAAKWPLNPMAVSADVPFMLGQQIGMGGRPEQPSSHINWARRHGMLRDEPLRPTMNPLLAAEAILSSPQFQQLGEYAREEATEQLRSQAYAMVGKLLQPTGAEARSELDEVIHPFDELEAEIEWRGRVEESALLGIKWDAKREAFAARGE